MKQKSGAPAGLARTRDRVLAHLRERPEGLTIRELAMLIGLKHNAVRKQLQALAADGVVSRERQPSTSAGRPPARYRASARGLAGHAERTLSRLLLRALGSLDVPAARQIGRESGPPSRLEDTLLSLGFAPTEVTSAAERRSGRRVIELCACPFLDLVGEPHGELICALHHGLVERDVPAGAALEEFRPIPEGPRCRIVLEAVAAGRPTPRFAPRTSSSAAPSRTPTAGAS
jgi:predicted ArsR family transcriptional regulator